MGLEGGGLKNGAPGIIGYSINQASKEKGVMLVGYVLCDNSGASVEDARARLWGG